MVSPSSLILRPQPFRLSSTVCTISGELLVMVVAQVNAFLFDTQYFVPVDTAPVLSRAVSVGVIPNSSRFPSPEPGDDIS